ncbi:MAG: N-acetylmuramic acid 6-phosphate etherase [bacterium]|nr:N-acetylmuramic acid 6-phosphate etherase [bacterium]
MSELPATEERAARSRDLDTRSSVEIVRLIVEDQRRAADAVLAQRAALASAIESIAQRLREGGRLHYVGAGTSGRLGVLDASEMPPTFGCDPSLVCAHIAGGERALRSAIEGAEDDEDAGECEMRGHVATGDAVIGLSASGGAPYVIGALRAARDAGAYTLALVNSPRAPLGTVAQDAIVVETGAEVLAGSTRLKAGTAQKIALNAISTGVMIRLGKVYDNVMVDVVATNAKLRARALRLLCELGEIDAERASELLARAGGSVKVAVVMARRGVAVAEARELLARTHGALRPLL